MARLQPIASRMAINKANAQHSAFKPLYNKPAVEIEWEVARKLQTSLDISQIIHIFHQEIQPAVPCKELKYTHIEGNIEVCSGKGGRHNCNYELKIADESIGHLRFSRPQRFSDADLQRIEELLCLLVHPLHNALLYKAAITRAMCDPLTGAYNRGALDTMLDKEHNLARRHGNALSIMMIDIDHFKDINDKYGHAMGDNALKALVKCISHNIRNSDTLFRYGGEEFCLILSNTEQEGAQLLAERIRQSVEEMIYIHEDATLQFTISIGSATLRADESVEKLHKRADEALYEAKSSGRNKVHIAELTQI